MRRAILALLVVGSTIATAGQSAGPQTGVSVGVVDRTNQHVSIASAGDLVTVVWAASKTGSGTDIYAASSQDAARTFSRPIRVNDASTPGDVNGEQPPQVVVARSNTAAIVTVVWTSKSSTGTRLVTSRSTDAGKTFGAATIVTGTEAPGNRGWESIAVDSRGRVTALWLDHREMARAGQGGEHHHAEGAAPQPQPSVSDGAARAQASQLFVGSIGSDGIRTRAIGRGVCYCCKTALAVSANGTLFAAWRDVYPGNYRDIAFTSSRDGGQNFGEPVRVHEDGWQIDGCPENGPTLAIDGDQRAHLIWPTLVRDSGRSTLALFHMSTRDGRTFSARAPLPVAGPAYHPRIVTTASGSLVAAWDEVVDGKRRIRVARGKPDAQGRVSFQIIESATVQGQYPALAATSSGVIIAWAADARAASGISIARVSD